MKRDDLRLELLKLAVVPGRNMGESIERAKELEAWILEVSEPKPSESEAAKPKTHKRREP